MRVEVMCERGRCAMMAQRHGYKRRHRYWSKEKTGGEARRRCGESEGRLPYISVGSQGLRAVWSKPVYGLPNESETPLILAHKIV